MCLPVKPFKVEREWKHAGLLCAVVQAREGGNRCGYVRVPPGHPDHGKNYNNVNVRVHGGLTFGAIEPCEHEDGTGFWFGFDCAHACDALYEPVYQESWGEEAKAVYRIHEKVEREMQAEYPSYHRRHEHYWLQEEVERETERLAEQLAEAHHGEQAKAQAQSLR